MQKLETIKPYQLCYIRIISGEWQPVRVLKTCETTARAGNVDVLTEDGYILKNVARMCLVRRLSEHPHQCRRYWAKVERARDGMRFQAGMWTLQGLIFGFFKDGDGLPKARLVQPGSIWDDPETIAGGDFVVDALKTL
jgi:hypothetical protein